MKTYGTATLEDGLWKIECEPHVAMRLKRVFGKVHLGRTAGTIVLTNNDETCRDLEWFADRYPLRFEPHLRLVESADRQRQKEASVQRLLEGRAPIGHFDLAIPAREYQKVAATMILEQGGLLLADDVGLGKTASSICTFTDPRALPVVVVTLTHLPRQWAAEVAKFAPQLRTHIIQSTKEYDLNACGGNRPCSAHVFYEARDGRKLCKRCGGEAGAPDVIIVSYSKLAAWAGRLAAVARSVVYDEVQELRRNESQKHYAAGVLSDAVAFRTGLSATPIYNYGSEIFWIMRALKPYALGTFEEFRREWCGGYGDRLEDPEAFGRYMREQGMMLRRTRRDVGRELPPISPILQEVDADTSHLEQVEERAAALSRIVLGLAGPAVRGEAWKASEELSMMVRHATGVGKAPYVADFVRLLVENGERLVLYGWHRDVYNIWLQRLEDLKPAMYTGTEDAFKKEEAKRRFVSGATPVLIMSLRSGAGLDGLQHVCRTVVFGELDWSPGVHEQCIGRVARDGQTDPVAAYYLVANSGSDPVVAGCLGVKRGQISGLRGEELVEKLEVDANHVKRLAEVYLKTKDIGGAA